LQFLLENGKNAPFHIKSPVKKFHGRAKGGGPSHHGPSKYATDNMHRKTCSKCAAILNNRFLHTDGKLETQLGSYACIPASALSFAQKVYRLRKKSTRFRNIRFSTV